MRTIEHDEERELIAVEHRLLREFLDAGLDVVRNAVRRCADRFQASKVRTFVPRLREEAARSNLRPGDRAVSGRRSAR
jgi:hypothetical protein